MAKDPTKKVARGPLKDRVLYMAYQGELQGEPQFRFNKDDLIDEMLSNRELKVKKITIPRSTRKKAPAATASV